MAKRKKRYVQHKLPCGWIIVATRRSRSSMWDVTLLNNARKEHCSFELDGRLRNLRRISEVLDEIRANTL